MKLSPLQWLGSQNVVKKVKQMLVGTRSQLENLSKEELTEKLINVENRSSKLSDLTSHFDDLLRRYEIPSFELAVTKNCNCLLSERIAQLERNMFNNAQHHCRESLELNTVPISVSNEVPESSICKALSLTSHEFKPNDLQACHRLKKKYTYYDTYYDEYFERNDNSDTITNPCDISNTFNNYFASIAENIKKNKIFT